MTARSTDVVLATIEAPKADAVIIGRPVHEALPEALSRMKRQRAFLMVSSSLRKNTDVINKVQQTLGSKYAGLYEGMPAHTPREAVIKATLEARKCNADVIVTIGGGSLTDAAKAVQIALAHDIEDTETLGQLRLAAPKRFPYRDLIVRQIAVPTTLSAGEFTNFAGVTDSQRKVKEPYGHRQSAPQVIILDPSLALHTPLSLWLSTGLRAVDHAVEALCSSASHPYAAVLASGGLRLLAQGLQRCKATPSDVAARQLCQLGMWQAVQAAVLAGGGASHAIGHTLGGTAGVPHGETSCVMLPAVLEWNSHEPAAASGLAAICGALDAAPGESAAVAVRKLIRNLGMPTTLQEVGVAEHQFQQLAEVTMEDRALQTNPRPVKSASDVVEMLRLASIPSKL